MAGVHQKGCGIPIKAQHAIITKDIVTDTMGREIGILNRANTENAGDSIDFLITHLRLALKKNIPGFGNRLHQKVA